MSSLAHHKQRRHHDDSVFLGMGDALGRANVGDKALTVIQLWWALRDSNPRPPRCKRGALTN